MIYNMLVYFEYRSKRSEYINKKKEVLDLCKKNKRAEAAAIRNGIADRIDKKIATCELQMAEIRNNSLILTILKYIGI